LLAFLLGAGECRQQQRGKNCDDGDDDEKFDESEGIGKFVGLAPHASTKLSEKVLDGKDILTRRLCAESVQQPGLVKPGMGFRIAPCNVLEACACGW
jgi:hypothetical protein